MNKKTPIYLASDHGGYQLKKRLIRYLENELGIATEDLGPLTHDPTDDYPDFALPLAKKVSQTKGYGILICRNGIGVCIAANKTKGVRAGIGYNLMAAETMMKDDDTNILCLAADLSSEEHALAIVKKWLETDFSQEERHIRRLAKVMAQEN
ncbi:MAG TPA: RpiB/LacA/LacB family sugar-phosphate isomerase [Patescibacteria group bacterium]|nr:RpiB/LacA/LacB family sugar-phosphate isomerase [Patescibacteria group bacterium]